jgi:hypothetical protein
MHVRLHEARKHEAAGGIGRRVRASRPARGGTGDAAVGDPRRR